jgi:hypothetical protein
MNSTESERIFMGKLEKMLADQMADRKLAEENLRNEVHGEYGGL